MAPGAVIAILLAASLSAAEPKEIAKGTGVIVTLDGGREVKGVYLGRHDDAVWVGLDGGEIGLEPSTILNIISAKTDDSEFLKRKAALGPDDAKGHWDLALWANKLGLETRAKEEARVVVGIEPEHLKARQLLRQEKIKGEWLEHDDAMRAKGLVEYQGEWITQSEFTRLEGIRIAEQEASYRLRLSMEYKARQNAIRSYSYSSGRAEKSGYTESYISAPKGTIR